MSTRSSLVYFENDKHKNHNIRIHVYHELHDNLIYLEIDCTTCYSGIKVPLDKHLARQLTEIIPESSEKK